VADESIEARLRLYERILASSRDHLALVDGDYVYRVVNDAYLAAHELRREQIEGRHVAELLGDASFEAVVKPNLDRAFAGEVVEYEAWFEFGGIGRRYMSVAYFPYEVDGEPQGALVRATDVTHVRSMQADLQDQHRRTALFLEVCQLGTWDWEIGSNDVRWSAHARELFGVGGEEFEGTYEAFLALVHPEDRAEVNAVVGHALEETAAADPYTAEFRLAASETEARWLLARGSVLRDAEGTPERMIGIIEDATERKSLEAQLSHSQKLDAMGRLAGGIAHDFNNLLTAILGSADLGRRAAQSARAREAFDTIGAAADRAATLVRSLLTFASARRSEPELVDVNEVVRQLRDMLARVVPEHIDLTVEQAPEPLYTLIDPGQLEQALLNLVVNARDAMPEGGHLRIRTGATRDDGVELEVIDDGCGIEESERDRVLEPFFTTKPPGEGSGLGLATCHGVVVRAGGELRIASEVDVGTTVTIRLPRRPAPEGPLAPLTPLEARRGAGEVVALVEDDAMVRATARQLLEVLGYAVIELVDGEVALEALRSSDSPASVVLTDVVMPKMNGPELARHLAEHRPELPVVFMSGYSRDVEPRPPADAPFLDKPFTLEALATALRSALDAG